MNTIIAPVTPAQMDHAMLRALMVGPVRALDLIARIPVEFERRGWPNDPDSIAVVACAIGAAKINAGSQRFTVPPALLTVSAWVELASGGKVTADQIVDGMELQDFLEPV